MISPASSPRRWRASSSNGRISEESSCRLHLRGSFSVIAESLFTITRGSDSEPGSISTPSVFPAAFAERLRRGASCCSPNTASTCSRFSGATAPVPFTTRETVAADTPARAAISLIVRPISNSP